MKEKLMRKIKLIILFSIFTLSNLMAEEGGTSFASNLLGYGGVLVTPTAYMPGDGTITATFSRIPKLYAAKLQPYQTSSVYTIDAGVFSFLEGFVSLVRPDHFKGGTGDRTAGLRLNFLQETAKRPALTVGMQDFFAIEQLDLEPSSAQVFASLYMVGSKSFTLHNRRIFTHLGYGTDWLPANTSQLVGLFGAMEIETLPKVFLMLENDAKKWNLGLRTRLFSHLQLVAGWWGLEEFSWSVSGSFNLQGL
ncbi:MAG TPA: YjbH domain-containing protein [bacterium]|nr:YjbH domain-containing protein [bacterium]